MHWRRAARSTWQSSLNIGGFLIVLFLLVFLFGACRVFFLKSIIPVGPAITETIGRHRLLLIKDAALKYGPYAASLAGAYAILYLIRRINRRDDSQYAALPPSDWDESAGP
jgi:hypothetical protein